MRFLLLSICIYLTFLVAWQLPTAKYIFSFSTLILKHGLGKNPDLAQLTRSISSSSLVNTDSVPENNLSKVRNPSEAEFNPTKLLPQLLDQLVALGQTAQQLRQAFSGNGHRADKLPELAQQLDQGSEYDQ